jgi:hypothetical protein
MHKQQNELTTVYFCSGYKVSSIGWTEAAQANMEFGADAQLVYAARNRMNHVDRAICDGEAERTFFKIVYSKIIHFLSSIQHCVALQMV